jgi:hypothetical protein
VSKLFIERAAGILVILGVGSKQVLGLNKKEEELGVCKIKSDCNAEISGQILRGEIR